MLITVAVVFTIHALNFAETLTLKFLCAQWAAYLLSTHTCNRVYNEYPLPYLCYIYKLWYCPYHVAVSYLIATINFVTVMSWYFVGVRTKMCTLDTKTLKRIVIWHLIFFCIWDVRSFLLSVGGERLTVIVHVVYHVTIATESKYVIQKHPLPSQAYYLSKTVLIELSRLIHYLGCSSVKTTHSWCGDCPFNDDTIHMFPCICTIIRYLKNYD